MRRKETSSGFDRRDFLKQLGAAGAVMCLWPSGSFASPQAPASTAAAPAVGGAIRYQCRTVSVRHLPEIKAWFETLIRKNKITDNATVRKYIGGFTYTPPADMPNPKSVLVVSLPQKIGAFTCHKGGKAYKILIAPGYFDDGVTLEGLLSQLKTEVIGKTDAKLVRARLPQKTMAVRSGLAEYGRNNISYVKGYGSFHQLWTFYAEEELTDQWRPLKNMASCTDCTICTEGCPLKCIRKENFVIDAGRCLALYNEQPDPMPAWMDPKVHNALVGCMKCQLTCPGNRGLTNDIAFLGEIDEQETELLLKGARDEKLEKSIVEKLKRFASPDAIPYLSRNLQLVFANTTPV